MITITCITKMTLYREEPRQGEIESELIYLNSLTGLHCMYIGLAPENLKHGLWVIEACIKIL